MFNKVRSLVSVKFLAVCIALFGILAMALPSFAQTPETWTSTTILASGRTAFDDYNLGAIVVVGMTIIVMGAILGLILRRGKRLG